MRTFSLMAATAAGALALAGSAQALTYISSDGNAQAIFTLSANKIIVDLTSLDVNPIDAAGEVSGIQIMLGGAPLTVGLGSATGALINISGGIATVDSSDTIDHWDTALVGSTIFLATAGTGSVGGKPHDLIIDGGGVYTHANNSIDVHNPEIKGTGHFTLNLTGAPTPTITGVKFEFGTTPDSVLGGVITGGVPEPASWALMILGFGGVGAVIRRRRSATAVA